MKEKDARKRKNERKNARSDEREQEIYVEKERQTKGLLMKER